MGELNWGHGAGNWPWWTPSQLFGLSSSKVQAEVLKLGWRSMIQPPGLGRNFFLCLRLEGGSEKLRGVRVGWGWEGFLPRTSEGPQRLTRSQVGLSSPLGTATSPGSKRETQG